VVPSVLASRIKAPAHGFPSKRYLDIYNYKTYLKKLLISILSIKI
jgi:hypothetical protein